MANGRVGEDAKEGKCTYVGARGSSLIDYIIVSQDLLDRFNSFSVGDPNIVSDHCEVIFSLCMRQKVDEPSIVQENDAIKITRKYVWNTSFAEQYKTKLASDLVIGALDNAVSNMNINKSNPEIDCSIEAFVNVLDSVCKPLFEKRTDISSTRRHDEIFNGECEVKKIDFLNKLDNYRAAKTDENREEMVKSRSDYKASVRKYKFELNKQRTQKLIVSKTKNAKEYWKLLKRSQTSTYPQSLSAQKFYEYFKSVNDPNSVFHQADEDVIYFNERFINSELQVVFSELDREITLQEITHAIKQSNTNKSGGPDMLLNEFFIHGVHILPCYLHKIFNTLLDKGYFPESWSEGHIVPIHKKGLVNHVENYRGITLLSTLGKLFTRVLNNRLTDWAEQYHVYIESQAGFRAKMGTVDNIFILHGLISHVVDQGKKLYCAFVDFTKAFDYVNRNILWYKLIRFGVRGKMLTIVQSIYAKVKSRVKYNNELSNDFDCYLGVRQGESLSPFLFSMYINDIESEFYTSGVKGIDIGMIKLFLLLYADDITIFSETAEGLQQGLNVLEQYCLRWRLIVNTEKTKIMVFRKGGILPRMLKFYYGETELDIVSSFSYLGIVFTPGGSFSKAQKTLSGQAQKAIFKLNSCLNDFVNVTPKHILELFDKLISPILNYGAEIWGFCKANQIERVHMQFCKRLLGVKISTQNNFIYGELGRLNYQTQRYLIIIKYWLKIVNSEEHKLIRKVYNVLLHDIERNDRIINWVSLVKRLLNHMGFAEVWMQQNVGNHHMFLLVFKQRLRDTFIQNWGAEINNSSRARFFKSFSSFNFQSYLDIISVKKFRVALSRLRVSSHRLEVEAGRWARPVRVEFENRKCLVCNKLEDEYHFVFECQLYENLRNKYIDNYYTTRPSMFKFVELLNTDRKKQIRNLSIFVHKAFEERAKIVYIQNV